MNEKTVLPALLVVFAPPTLFVLCPVLVSLPRSFLAYAVIAPSEETTSIAQAMRLHSVLWDHALVLPWA